MAYGDFEAAASEAQRVFDLKASIHIWLQLSMIGHTFPFLLSTNGHILTTQRRLRYLLRVVFPIGKAC